MAKYMARMESKKQLKGMQSFDLVKNKSASTLAESQTIRSKRGGGGSAIAGDGGCHTGSYLGGSRRVGGAVRNVKESSMRARNSLRLDSSDMENTSNYNTPTAPSSLLSTPSSLSSLDSNLSNLSFLYDYNNTSQDIMDLSPAEAEAVDLARQRSIALMQCRISNTLFVDDIGFPSSGPSMAEKMGDEDIMSALKRPTSALRYVSLPKNQSSFNTRTFFISKRYIYIYIYIYMSDTRAKRKK